MNKKLIIFITIIIIGCLVLFFGKKDQDKNKDRSNNFLCQQPITAPNDIDCSQYIGNANELGASKSVTQKN